MIKVFSGDKIIYLTDNIMPVDFYKDFRISIIKSAKEMKAKYNEILSDAKSDSKEIYFYNKDGDLLFDFFSSMFRYIEAGGGLVKNKDGAWLFIFRNGKWDLPKGKREKGETKKSCALREVEEECGIKDLTITKKLPSTYHTYYMEEKPVLKRTYWYEMECADTSKLIPQTEEGITDVRWIKKKDLQIVVTNTYLSILEVIKEI